MKIHRAIEILSRYNHPTTIINRDLKDQSNFRNVMEYLGNPHQLFNIIHITGTNGKGSVALKTASVLQKAGHTVGLYISPHILSFRQRIQVNRSMISQDSVSDKLILIDQICQRQNIKLTYFEYLTGAAFLHFKEMNCKYVSLQVGLGGRNDTTNIVNPLVSVITSIGLDHTEVLGPKIQNIAWQKAGIIKQNRPVILGPSAQIQVIKNYAETKKSKIYEVEDKKYKDFDYQNIAITKRVIQVLKQETQIPNKAIEQGLKENQPCRMQVLQSKYLPEWCKSKKVYFDVGHNPHALIRVVEYLQNRINISKQKICVLFGSSKNKNINDSLSLLQNAVGHIYLVQADHKRAMPVSELQSWIGMSKYPHKYRMIEEGNIKKTLLYSTSDPNCEVVLVCGTFFMMKEAKSFFQPQLMQTQIDESISECAQLKQNIEYF